VGSEVLLEQVQLNFSFRNKFIIVLPCGLLVDNKHILKKSAFLKCITCYTDDGGYANQKSYILIIIKSKAMESLCLLF